MRTFVPLLLLATVVLAGVPLLRDADAMRRSKALRRNGFVWMMAVATLGGLFIAGETLADPGGGAAVGMLLAWSVPLAALSWLAWTRPAVAQPVLVVAVAAVLALSFWSVAGWEGHRAFRDQQGPYAAIAAFVVGIALAVLGLHRLLAAGLMLLVTGIGPLLIIAVGSGAPLGGATGGSLGAASLPGLVTATLYLLAYRAQHLAPTRTLTSTR
jgi:hypothetical protein